MEGSTRDLLDLLLLIRERQHHIDLVGFGSVENADAAEDLLPAALLVEIGIVSLDPFQRNQRVGDRRARIYRGPPGIFRQRLEIVSAVRTGRIHQCQQERAERGHERLPVHDEVLENWFRFDSRGATGTPGESVDIRRGYQHR